MRSRQPFNLALISACGASALMLGGCLVDPFSRDSALRADPTPELLTLYERDVDAANSAAITFNENERMFWQDLGRAMYWDRPSRLTREPIPR